MACMLQDCAQCRDSGYAYLNLTAAPWDGLHILIRQSAYGLSLSEKSYHGFKVGRIF